MGGEDSNPVQIETFNFAQRAGAALLDKCRWYVQVLGNRRCMIAGTAPNPMSSRSPIVQTDPYCLLFRGTSLGPENLVTSDKAYVCSSSLLPPYFVARMLRVRQGNHQRPEQDLSYMIDQG